MTSNTTSVKTGIVGLYPRICGILGTKIYIAGNFPQAQDTSLSPESLSDHRQFPINDTFLGGQQVLEARGKKEQHLEAMSSVVGLEATSAYTGAWRLTL